MKLKKILTVNGTQYSLEVTNEKKLMGARLSPHTDSNIVYRAFLEDKVKNRSEIKFFRSLSVLKKEMQNWIISCDSTWKSLDNLSKYDDEILREMKEWDGVIEY